MRRHCAAGKRCTNCLARMLEASGDYSILPNVLRRSMIVDAAGNKKNCVEDIEGYKIDDQKEQNKKWNYVQFF